MYDALAELTGIDEPSRRQIILEETYYDFYGLKTPEEEKHPFTGILALQSEDNFGMSTQRSRIDAFFDLELHSFGFTYESLGQLPRETVEYIIKKATLKKADKLRSDAKLAANIQAGMGMPKT